MSEVAFAAAISEDRKHCALVAAGRSQTGKVLVDLLSEPYHLELRFAAATICALWQKHDPVAVVVNPKAQSGTLIRPLEEFGIFLTIPSAEDIATAHGEFLDLVNDGGLEHLGQQPLTDAVRSAQQRPLAGAKAWEPRLTVDQSPLVAATLAVWGFLGWERVASPSAWTL